MSDLAIPIPRDGPLTSLFVCRRLAVVTISLCAMPTTESCTVTFETWAGRLQRDGSSVEARR
jgi:hypothetical protein